MDETELRDLLLNHYAKNVRQPLLRYLSTMSRGTYMESHIDDVYQLYAEELIRNFRLHDYINIFIFIDNDGHPRIMDEIGFQDKCFYYCRKRFLNYRRRRKFGPEYGLRGGDENQVNDLTEKSVDPADELIQKERVEAVMRAVDTLDLVDRQIFHLYHIEDFTYESISKIMGKPLGTIKSRISRLPHKLKDKLSHLFLAEDELHNSKSQSD